MRRFGERSESYCGINRVDIKVACDVPFIAVAACQEAYCCHVEYKCFLHFGFILGGAGSLSAFILW